MKFEENSALDGGGIYSTVSELVSTIVGNVAERRGGGLVVTGTSSLVEISANFSNNTAKVCGGAVYTGPRINMNFNNFTAIRNSGSALCTFDNNILHFHGNIDISENSGKLGGGITVISNSIVSFVGNTLFEGNRALVGGAIYSLYETEVFFSGVTVFTHNTADTDGGALYALSAGIIIKDGNRISFTAENGGAMYLAGATFLTFGDWVNVTTSHNNASNYGGAIFYEDVVISTQCNFDSSPDQSKLPFCFTNFTQLVYVSYCRC